MKTQGKKLVEVPRDELTFEERHQILWRCRFWADLFVREAESIAEYGSDNSTDLRELVKGLEEKRYVVLRPDSAVQFERMLLSERDPIALWRTAKGLENHQLMLLNETLALYPEKKERLKYFHVVSF